MGREEEVKQTPNSESIREQGAERPTPNVEGRTSAFPMVGRWTLGVGRLPYRLLELAIGLLFIYTGALKAWDPVGFAGDIQNYHMLPWPIGVRMAFYLPWLEIICGLALIFRRATKGATFILAMLVLAFIAATIVAKARGLDVSCGCFGHAARNLSFAWHLAIDLGILALIVIVWRGAKETERTGIAESPRASW